MTAIATTAAEADLARRLAEAEDTLRAIREGEVDALVMRGPEDDEVFALGAQDSYRAFMEAIDIGAAALDADGRVIYANAALTALLGVRAGQLGDIPAAPDLYAALGDAGDAVRALIADADGQRRSRQIRLTGATGPRHVEVAVAPLALGFGAGHALTFTDVTDRVEAIAAHESDRIGFAIMASSNEAMLICNRAGVITHANAGARAVAAGPVTDAAFDTAFPIECALASGLLSGADLIGVALAGSPVRGVEATLGPRHLVLSAVPLRQSGGLIGGCVVAIADVTEAKAAEHRQTLLLGELTHRIKNTLTLVMAIANRTVAATTSLPEFREAFGRRIQALAATHDLLAHQPAQGLTLRELVAAELAPYVHVESGRVRLANLDLRTAADTAVPLGLIIHELVTNAVKYGALSNDTGHVAITAQPAAAGIELVWEESGGPPVIAPTRTGFGQKVIGRGLGHGATHVDFRREGLVCHIHVPTTAIG